MMMMMVIMMKMMMMMMMTMMMMTVKILADLERHRKLDVQPYKLACSSALASSSSPSSALSIASPCKTLKIMQNTQKKRAKMGGASVKFGDEESAA